MTKEEIKELLPLLQAFVNGKEIECYDGEKWRNADFISFDKLVYRIKSEQKYRPFKTKEECWNEMLKHQPFGWIVNKTNKHFYLINCIYDYKSNNGYCVLFNQYQFANITLNYDRILKDYEFADGKPFGIKEE